MAIRRSRGCPVFAQPATEAAEEPAAQYLHIAEAEEDVQGTQAAVAALQDLRYTSESGSVLHVGAWGCVSGGGQVTDVAVATVMCSILPFTQYLTPPPATVPRGADTALMARAGRQGSQQFPHPPAPMTWILSF